MINKYEKYIDYLALGLMNMSLILFVSSFVLSIPFKSWFAPNEFRIVLNEIRFAPNEFRFASNEIRFALN